MSDVSAQERGFKMGSKSVDLLPHWISSRVNEEDLKKISDAVHRAELKTSAEIVPMIVQRSSAIAHVPMSVFLLLALVWMTFVPFIASYISNVSMIFLEMGGVLVAFILSAFIGHWTAIQRLFVPSIDQAAQVDDRAELEFFESNIKATRESTGILIFVSLLEHRAVVLADKTIADHFRADVWDEVVRGLLGRIKSGDVAGGFVWAIERCGELVSPHFPIQPDDKNELGNELIIKS